MVPEAGSPWLLRLLRDIQLAQFYRSILEELNVTRPEHFDFVRPQDLDGIGMGRPGEGPLAPRPQALFPQPVLCYNPHAPLPHTSPLLTFKFLASSPPPPILPSPSILVSPSPAQTGGSFEEAPFGTQA